MRYVVLSDRQAAGSCKGLGITVVVVVVVAEHVSGSNTNKKSKTRAQSVVVWLLDNSFIFSFWTFVSAVLALVPSLFLQAIELIVIVAVLTTTFGNRKDTLVVVVVVVVELL